MKNSTFLKKVIATKEMKNDKGQVVVLDTPRIGIYIRLVVPSPTEAYSVVTDSPLKSIICTTDDDGNKLAFMTNVKTDDISPQYDKTILEGFTAIHSVENDGIFTMEKLNKLFEDNLLDEDYRFLIGIFTKNSKGTPSLMDGELYDFTHAGLDTRYERMTLTSDYRRRIKENEAQKKALEEAKEEADKGPVMEGVSEDEIAEGDTVSEAVSDEQLKEETGADKVVPFNATE